MKYVILKRIGNVNRGVSQHGTKKEALKALRILRNVCKEKSWWVSPIYVNRFFHASCENENGKCEILVQIMGSTDFWETQDRSNFENWVDSQNLPQD